MPDNVGPKSSSSDFEWPAWQQGDAGGGTRRGASEPASSGATSTGSDSGGTQHETYATSESPPPIIDAFPEQNNPYEPVTAPENDDPGQIPWPLTVTVIAACIMIVVLIGILVAVINHRGDSSGPSNPTAMTSATPSTTEPPVTVTSEETQTQTVTVTPAPTTSATPFYPSPTTYYPPYGSSLQQLQQQVRSDHDVVLRGATSPDRWVPQLGSKKLGTVDSGKTYGYDDILANYNRLKVKYPGARLLWSGDWSTFEESDFWVTIANITFPTAGDALNWCRSQVGTDNEGCYAKLISTTHPVEGSTAYQ